MTARAIQRHLYSWCNDRRHILMLPNHHYGWEADFVSVTRSLMVTVFEIKISLQDFRADFKKERHRFYSDGRDLPNLFYYVVPQELQDRVQPLLPPHAGLMVVSESQRHQCQVVTRAPFNHLTPLDYGRLMKMAKSLMHRYYTERDRNRLLEKP